MEEDYKPIVLIELNRYGRILKKYLQEYYPLKYECMIIDCTLFEYLETKQQELMEYAKTLENQFKKYYPKPTSNSFLEHAKYNNFMQDMVHEFIIAEISKIRLES